MGKKRIIGSVSKEISRNDFSSMLSFYVVPRYLQERESPFGGSTVLFGGVPAPR